MEDSIGYIVGGGLREGFRVRLTVPAHEVQEGSFVVCDSGRWRFFGLVTNLQLGATDPRFADEQSDRLSSAIQQALLGRTLYTTLEVYATLMMDMGPADDGEFLRWQEQVEQGIEQPGPKPVKTVPTHHSKVRLADEGDVAEIFGKAGKNMLELGQTIEQGHPVRIDLAKLVKRSSGIFGATGTGKSFLTRMVLAGMMKEDVAGALVFDMHNEYAYDDLDSDNNVNVQGLKSLFGSKVQVAGLGAGARVRGNSPDFTLEIGYSDFEQDDMALLASALKLTDVAPIVLAALHRSFGKEWLKQFMQMIPGLTEEDENGKRVPAPESVEYWANGANVNSRSANTLHGRLKRLTDRAYVVERPAGDAVASIVDQLQNGRHVILSFGEYDNDLDYLLVSNILTRRIRSQWVSMTDHAKTNREPNPKPIVIAIEEAHKLLSPQLASQTAFGVIARELRKYFVTLLVVDQRPSGIDDEIMSQLGTRITGWLGDEDDIRAVLTGLAGRDQLRGMLARLQEKQEVLLLGWGVKMPIPIKSRRYDDAFYAEMKGKSVKKKLDSIDDINDLLGLGH
ncbi:MAG: ATP-binding protein [Chloroflexota bacterium]